MVRNTFDFAGCLEFFACAFVLVSPFGKEPVPEKSGQAPSVRERTGGIRFFLQPELSLIQPAPCRSFACEASGWAGLAGEDDLFTKGYLLFGYAIPNLQGSVSRSK